MHPQAQSPLLQLPVELQLDIYEFVVRESHPSEPLLVNCPCDSNFEGDGDAWDAEQQRWDRGDAQPPVQPALTMTCAAVRALALPLYYQQNVFRAHYCYATDKHVAVAWLDRIGPVNRSDLRDFCFWDMNPWFDKGHPSDLVRLKRTKVFRQMRGTMVSSYPDEYCCHRVTFADEADDEWDGLDGLFAGGADGGG